MKQITFAFEHDEASYRSPPALAEREQLLVELMAQAIAALLPRPWASTRFWWQLGQEYLALHEKASR